MLLVVSSMYIYMYTYLVMYNVIMNNVLCPVLRIRSLFVLASPGAKRFLYILLNMLVFAIHCRPLTVYERKKDIKKPFFIFYIAPSD